MSHRQPIRIADRHQFDTLIDARSPAEFAQDHIPGAINLPVADLARRAAAVLPDRSADIVTYCGSPT